MTKKRVPPGGTWVLLAGEVRPGLWTAAVYTEIGEPIASAIDGRREVAVRAAMGAALERARPVRVLTDEDVGELAVAVAPLGDEHEELRARFAEDLAVDDDELEALGYSGAAIG